MTPADAIKAVREAWDEYDECAKAMPKTPTHSDMQALSDAYFAVVDLLMQDRNLPVILARAEAFERIRALRKGWHRQDGLDMVDIIDEVEAAEKAGGL